MRQIVVDTETTGLEVARGHRVIEIGCVEMIARRVTGNTFHHYLNPSREVDDAAFEVHGITAAMLRDKPAFGDVAEALLEFIRGAELIIHNAPFDLGFLNGEFHSAGFGDGVVEAHCEVLDTMALARRKHPGQRNNLDALCKRYSIDNAERTLHGALLDAEILADVYLAMTGGQTNLLGDAEALVEYAPAQSAAAPATDGKRIATPLTRANDEELAAHRKWLQLLEENAPGKVVWKRGESADQTDA